MHNFFKNLISGVVGALVYWLLTPNVNTVDLIILGLVYMGTFYLWDFIQYYISKRKNKTL